MQYSMMTSGGGLYECQGNEADYLRHFKELSYLWNMPGAGKELSK